MRIFAVSDLHVDFLPNAQWVEGLSRQDYVDDLLILAGDVSDAVDGISRTLSTLARRFRHVLFVPGNHELWVHRSPQPMGSLTKFREVMRAAAEAGASLGPYSSPALRVVPLLSWYDFTFGEPTEELRATWMDFHACRWPPGFDEAEVAAYFMDRNALTQGTSGQTTISFSHFLPRIDIMPAFVPQGRRILYPVLGSERLDAQIRALASTLHVYGHSHINRRIEIDGVTYINNAFGYPHEGWISAKQLCCIHDG